MVLFCWLRNIWLVEILVAGFARAGQTFRPAVAYRLRWRKNILKVIMQVNHMIYLYIRFMTPLRMRVRSAAEGAFGNVVSIGRVVLAVFIDTYSRPAQTTYRKLKKSGAGSNEKAPGYYVSRRLGVCAAPAYTPRMKSSESSSNSCSLESFWRSCLSAAYMWFSTVRGEMPSCSPISRFERSSI